MRCWFPQREGGSCLHRLRGRGVAGSGDSCRVHWNSLGVRSRVSLDQLRGLTSGSCLGWTVTLRLAPPGGREMTGSQECAQVPASSASPAFLPARGSGPPGGQGWVLLPSPWKLAQGSHPYNLQSRLWAMAFALGALSSSGPGIQRPRWCSLCPGGPDVHDPWGRAHTCTSTGSESERTDAPLQGVGAQAHQRQAPSLQSGSAWVRAAGRAGPGVHLWPTAPPEWHPAHFPSTLSQRVRGPQAETIRLWGLPGAELSWEGAILPRGP